MNTSNLALDFSGLFDDNSPKSPKISPDSDFSIKRGVTPLNAKKPPDSGVAANRGIPAKTAQLQQEIYKGIISGERCYILLLKVIEALSAGDHTGLLYQQARAAIIALYGREAIEPLPETEIQRKIDQINELQEAYLWADAAEQQTIARAIEAHQDRLEELEKSAK